MLSWTSCRVGSQAIGLRGTETGALLGSGVCRHVAVLLLLLSPSIAMAADWPTLQGPQNNGQTTEQIDPWPEAGPEVLWTKDLGRGYSSVAVDKDYCVTLVQTSLDMFVVCLRVQNGEPVWKTRCGDAYEAFGVYPGPRSTPVLTNGHVYYATPHGEVGCLVLETGARVWRQQLITDLERQGVGFGYSASPLVIKNRVYLPCGGPGQSVVALDAATGERVWGAGDAPASYCPIVPMPFDGETLLIAYLQNNMLILDLAGAILWKNELSTGYDEHSSLPVCTGNNVMFTAPFRAGATACTLESLLKTDKGRSLKVRQLWIQPKFSNDVTSCVARDGLLLGFDLRDAQSKVSRPSRGTFRALDMLTGEVLWSNEEIGQAGLILAGDGQLLAFNDAGELLLVDVSRTAGTVRCKSKVFTDEVCWTRPAVANGRLYLRGTERLICLRVGTIDNSSRSPSGVTRLADLPNTRQFPWQIWLLQGEREHPLMLPESVELMTWFFTGGICLLLPFAVACGVARSNDRRVIATHVMRALLAGVALSVVATPVLNRWASSLPQEATFHFTWPAAIYALLLQCLLARQLAMQYSQENHLYWQARLWFGLWLFVSWGYYSVLRENGLPLQWVFLLGYVTALPCCFWIARGAIRSWPIWKTAVAVLLGYGVFFWPPVLYAIWNHE